MRKGILDIDAYNTGHWKTLGAFTEGLWSFRLLPNSLLFVFLRWKTGFVSTALISKAVWEIKLNLMRNGSLELDAYNKGHWKTLGTYTEELWRFGLLPNSHLFLFVIDGILELFQGCYFKGCVRNQAESNETWKPRD
jgi:hypothetical protein